MAHLWLAAGFRNEGAERRSIAAAGMLTVRLERADAAGGKAGDSSEDRIELSEAQAHTAAETSAPAVHNPPRALKNAASVASPVVAAPREATRLPLPADAVYYAAHELDAYPAPLGSLRFAYPERAAREQVGGQIVILLLVDAAGAVEKLSVVTADPPGYFEDSVQAAFAAARFSPARKDGRAVRSRLRVSVSYEPGAAEGALR